MRISPLYTTVGILACLFLAWFPLRALTYHSGTAPAAPADDTDSPAATQLVAARLHLLADAEFVALRDPSGSEILAATPFPAGRHDLSLPLTPPPDTGEIVIEASFRELEGETAVFLTLSPDGLPDASAHAIGGASFTRLLEFDWPQPAAPAPDR